MAKYKENQTVMGAEKSMTEAQIQNENVDKVIKKISSELKSLNAIIRAFVDVAENDSFANYMIETICENKKDARIVLNVNEIKKCIIKAYPYKDGNTMLKKDGDLYVPFESYTPSIIKQAFYGIVRPKKDVKVIAATPEQIEAHQAAKTKKTNDAKIKKEDEKKSIDTFIERLMNAGNKDLAWAIVQEYKANHVKTEQDDKTK